MDSAERIVAAKLEVLRKKSRGSNARVLSFHALYPSLLFRSSLQHNLKLQMLLANSPFLGRDVPSILHGFSDIVCKTDPINEDNTAYSVRKTRKRKSRALREHTGAASDP